MVRPGQYADLSSAIIGLKPTTVRIDTAIPVMDGHAEPDVTGVLDSVAAPQPDNSRFRLWEVAGTSHADVHLLGPISSTIDCGAPINNRPVRLVAKAAFHALDTWVDTGIAPLHGPTPRFDSGRLVQARGERRRHRVGWGPHPPVDVPVAVLSGAPGPNPTLLRLLLGSTSPLPSVSLVARYPTRADYVWLYRSHPAATIRAGFDLAADGQARLGFAAPSRLSG